VKFDQPAWLILLVLLPLLGVGAILTARLRRRQWSAFTAPRLRSSLLRRGSPLPRWFALFFLLAGCGALIIALARPQGDAGTRTEKALGRNVIVALDLSRSMRVADVKPDRLSQAKMVIYELLEAMPNERIGLIGFAGNSFLYAPLTVDHNAVRETVEQIDETWAPLGGSDLAGAIKLAVDTFKKTGQKNNALVIISDGEETTKGKLDNMIHEAAQSGVYILAIGVGTADGDYVPNKDFADKLMYDRSGNPVISRLQPDVMRKLAAETKGRYAVAGSGMDIPAMVKASIKDLDAFEVEGRERRVSIEFYQWLVLPAVVFLMGSILAGTRWKGVNPAPLAALVFLTPTPSRADEVSAARDALVQKHHTEARNAYRKLAETTRLGERKARFRLGEATAAYRGGDFRQARTAYSRALLSEEPEVLANAHTGMGNTLFQLGWRGLSEEAYPGDAAHAPDLEKFDALAKEALAKLNEGNDESGDPSAATKKFESLITDWTDAVRHYDSSLAINPSNEAAKHNRKLTMTYLKRLRELMQEEKEETEQSMPQPQPQPQEGKPQEGDGEPKEKKPGDKGEDDPKQPGDQGKDEDKNQKGSGGEQEKKDEKSGGEKKDKDSKKDGKRPDETPEEEARRILKENADTEKGPLTPGRREFRPAEKDW